MKALSLHQFLFIAGVLILIAAMSFVPVTAPVVSKPELKHSEADAFDLHETEERLRSSIPPEILSVIKGLEAEEKNHANPASIKEQLAVMWDSARALPLAARYYEELAQLKPSEKNWLNAAYRYFDVFMTSENAPEKKFFTQKAVLCYSKVLELNPKNLDAKTDLGVCLAENTENPMQGIMLLREVVAENPNHENAQFNLGVLSIRSKQYEKAVERFEKVLQLNPSRIDLYIYIAESYLETGNKEKAVTYFEKYKTVSKDSITIREVNRYIEKLKEN